MSRLSPTYSRDPYKPPLNRAPILDAYWYPLELFEKTFGEEYYVIEEGGDVKVTDIGLPVIDKKKITQLKLTIETTIATSLTIVEL